MRAHLHLGRIWGIPIGLHWSWFLVFALVTWTLAFGYFPQEYPFMPSFAYWLLGALTSLCFFGSILLHELGHSYVALRNGIPVRGITLFIFGGVAQITQEPRTPGVELRIAIAGPCVSLGLAGLFYGLWLVDQPLVYLAAPSLWLARINFIVALFNLIPGFPLDGGRVLRALVWWFNGNFKRATQVGAFTGQLVAFGFMGLGVFTSLGGQVFNGLWLVFIGWFLQNAAVSSRGQIRLQELLHGVTVDHIMHRDIQRVAAWLSVQCLVEDIFLTGSQRFVIVEEHGHLKGMMTLSDLRKVARDQWPDLTVAQVMTPWEHVHWVLPETEIVTALQRMDDANVAQLPVIQGEEIVGVLSRERILHHVRLRTELDL